MNVLVFGSNGWIGSQFIDILQEKHIPYIKATSRADNKESVLLELAVIKPTHVVSFIGRTHGKIGSKVYSTIDYLEQDGKLVENVHASLCGGRLEY